MAYHGFTDLFTIKPTQYSKYFSLADLTRTDTGLSNKPSSSDVSKLQSLGKILDLIYEKIGPFKIVSGYRAPAVQSALKAGGNTQAVKTSYHSSGQAADIMPTNQNVKDFFAKITNTPEVKNALGGYAIKTNVIHFDTDTSTRRGVAMYVDKAGNYIRFGASELVNFISKNKAASTGLLIAGSAALILIVMSMRGKK